MAIYTNVTLAGGREQVQVSALVDTGAEISLIPNHIARSIGAWVTGQTTWVTGVHGDVREFPTVLANVFFSMLNNAGGGFPFVMSNVAKDVIVGVDIMNRLGITVDTKTGFLSIRNDVQEGLKTLLALAGGATLVFLGLKSLASLDNDVAQCNRCGHLWSPRVKNPAKCPKCGSYGWGG